MTTLTAPKSTPGATDRIFNFSAGPGVLPEEVLRQAQKDMWNIYNSGIGILEHSHRGKVFDRVLAECEADLRALGSIPDTYRVFFVQGGASSQCHMVPMNFARPDQTADYFLTGKWASDSVDAARSLCKVNIVGSSKDTNFDRIPDKSSWKFSKDAVYCHFTSNNTIFGTEFPAEPVHPHGAPLVCDASSDIFSRPIDVTRYGLIYAGAQKNLGPAGAVLVIAHNDFLARQREDLPRMLKYKTYSEEESRPNTPPTFAIYLVGQVVKWMLANGGIKGMTERNREKAAMVYDYLDSTDFYTGHAQKTSRSLMNITFKCRTEDLDKKFIKEAEQRGLDGLKGHRSTGGMRASMYNAFPIEGARALVAFMKEFEKSSR